jgi:hypothetical protein
MSSVRIMSAQKKGRDDEVDRDGRSAVAFGVMVLSHMIEDHKLPRNGCDVIP